MVLTVEQKRVRDLLTETVTLLCKNGLNFNAELGIEALIGITIDKEEVFLVSIKETIASEINAVKSSSVKFSGTSDFANDVEPTARSETYSNNEKAQGVPLPSCSQRAERRIRKNSNTKPEIGLPSTTNSANLTAPVDFILKSEIDQEEVNNSDRFDRTGYEPLCKRRRAEGIRDKSPVTEIEIANSFSISSTHTKVNAAGVVRLGAVDSEHDIEQISNDSCLIEIKEERTDEEWNCSMIDSFYANSLHEMNGWNTDSEVGRPVIQMPDMMSPAGQLGGGRTLDPQSQKSRKKYAFTDETLSYVGRPDETDARRCPVCGVVSENWNMYLRHIRKHQPGMYRCPFCGKQFSGSTNLRGHLALHTNVREFACHLCEKAYAYKKDLNEHLVLKHGHALLHHELSGHSSTARHG